MRRTTAAVFGTLSGTALLLAAKFGADAAAAGKGAAGADPAAAAGGQLAPGAAASAAPGTGRSSPAPGRTGAGRSRTGTGAGGAAANGLKNGVFRGSASVNPYGPIQVTIKVANGRITAVTATHATSPARTLQVNRRAIPLLRQEALQAQSARIDAVSGATYTSRSFAASLQSALAAARA
ncbi:hypothetical protein Acsp04_22900 [Actinomadura sp. NBRC 104425]|uniref:FMN-binding protein n=1 Tax=Actinomadura sp. NBRC 104425 TaxID=3032204 RepID=UPI0024A363B4|nr:FMN-binding protein [Actinomadura sp. NBRC 104425]GLZ12055.1 hypothetical protein Acsp04_22900 [Actinomadura sp. NBRC 104425]